MAHTKDHRHFKSVLMFLFAVLTHILSAVLRIVHRIKLKSPKFRA